MSPSGAGAVLIAGAGPGIGAAVAKRFARAGYNIIAARRNGNEGNLLCEEIKNEGGFCRSVSCDFRKEEEVFKLVQNTEEEFGSIHCGIHNVGANIGHMNVVDTSARKYFKSWELAAFSAFLFGREVSKNMIARNKGTIIFTGATASTRGSAGHCAFSGAMMAKRSFAQSLAREAGPQGVHVAHAVIDGVIDNPNTLKFFSENEQFASKLKELTLILPDDIADIYLSIHAQARSAWTHELDIRPWNEKW